MHAPRMTYVLPFILFFVTFSAVGGEIARARQLKEDAIKILQSGSAMEVDPDTYADCVIKLETAIQLLESGQANDENLLQEATSALYWARKFTTVTHIQAIERKRGKPVTPRKKPTPPKLKPATNQLKKEAPSPLADARRQYQKGETFAQAHGSDLYAVALNWFQVADQLSGTDYAIKALGNARKAQEQFQAIKSTTVESTDPKAKKAPKETLSPLTLEAQALSNRGELDAAIKAFDKAAKKEQTAAAFRRLGHAYFQRGQQVKEKLLARFEATEQSYRTAYRNALYLVRSARGSFYRLNKRDPALIKVWQEMAGLRKEAQASFVFYDKARFAFNSVLNFAKNSQDLDAAAHKCLCLSVRGAMVNRLRARQELLRFLKTYKPSNDIERTLYAFCETEFERIQAK